MKSQALAGLLDAFSAITISGDASPIFSHAIANIFAFKDRQYISKEMNNVIIQNLQLHDKKSGWARH